MANPCATCPLFECQTDEGVPVRQLHPLAETALLAYSCASGGGPGTLRWEMTRVELTPGDLDVVLALMDTIGEVNREYEEFRADEARRDAARRAS